jgi:hypothetical protein
MGKGLRIATWTGLVLVLLVHLGVAVTSLSGTFHARGLIACAVISLAVTLALRFAFRAELDTLLFKRDLLLPLAMLTVLEFGVIHLIALGVAPLAAVTPLSIGAISLGLSFTGVLLVVANIAYSVWATFLVVQALDGPVDLGDSRRGSPGKPWVLAVLAFIGWTTPLAAIGLAIPIAGAGGIGVVIGFVGIFSLIWNLGTSAWLVGAASRGWGLGTALIAGWRTSWSHVRRLAWPVTLQLLLAGWITYFSVSFTRYEGSTTHSTSRNSWYVNGFWTGGYRHSTDWYADYMKVLEEGTLTFVLVVLQLVFGVLALAVRLRVARHVAPVRFPPPDEPKTATPEEPRLQPGVDYSEY